MTADREFVSTTGTKHRMDLLFDQAACDRRIQPEDLVVQGWVKDCKRCYPKGAQ